jgi:hypothetical protein
MELNWEYNKSMTMLAYQVHTWLHEESDKDFNYAMYFWLGESTKETYRPYSELIYVRERLKRNNKLR